MHKLVLLAALAVLAASPALAQQWEARGKEFVLTLGDEEIAYAAPGTISAGRRGGPRTTAALFLWHDAYVYERLDQGTVTAGPALDARGWVVQSGTWVSREGAPPMRYSLAVEPTTAGAVLHLETEKTAPLKLSAGLWATITVSKEAFAGRRVWARPGANGKIGRAVGGECDALLIETAPGRALSFAGDGFQEVRSRVSDTTHGFEMCLRPGDFPVGERAQTSLRVAFEAMPARFPGQIEPARERLSIGPVTPSTTSVPRWGKLELAVDLHATWDNPFDPDDVALDAEVTTASGKRYSQPGFFLVDYRREVRNGAEMMVPQGDGRWCVRLAATEPGPLRVKLTARDRSGTVSKDAGPFAVRGSVGVREYGGGGGGVTGSPPDSQTPTPSHPHTPPNGFLRQSRVDPHYLQFDSGAPFFPIGHNLPIYHASGQLGLDAIRKMAANGENYNRWWMSSSGFGLEWDEHLGWYRQATAARIDAALDLAEQLDFYYMMCMDTHQDFRENGWKANPFNQANGGPCAGVSDWFTNAEARALYKKRLRYTVARWGYSPNVLCWEFGNEFEGWADTTEATKIAWHREMAAYLAKLDPYRHLITTSWWGHTGPEACWQIPEMDIVQTHCYTNNDANVADQVRGYCLEQWTKFPKPHIFGEFGIRSHSTTADKDPKGWGLHNAYWAAVASGAVGIPMPWWHENYIEPLDLYFHFAAIANFTKGLPFGTERWEQVKVAPLEYVRPPNPPIARDVILTPASQWAKPAANEFVVQPDGSVNDAGQILELLHGQGHKDLQNPPTFVVTYPKPGKFILRVGRVSNSGLLRIRVDGELKLERAFPCGEKIGKEWKFQEQWNLWESQYDEDVAIDVPAGKHRIQVENDGKDWMRIGAYVFTGCKVIDRPDLLVASIRASGGTAIAWIQNRESDWFNHGKGEVTPVPPARLTLDGFPDGTYDVEWWETWRGKPLRAEKVTARGGKLLLLPGEVKTDVAAKIVRRSRDGA